MMLRANKLLTIFFYVMVIFALPVFASQQKNNQPKADLAQFGSDSAQCLETEDHGKINNICTYSGNAKFDQGDMHLHAPKIVVYKDAPTNAIYQIIAFGDAKNKAYYSTLFTPENKNNSKPADTNETKIQKKISGFANIIKIFPPKNLITLTGDAEIDRESDKFDGEYFEYDTKKQTVFAKPSSLGQTKMVIYPNN